MAIYYVNEASFELPDLQVVDRTVHVLELGGGALPGLGLMLARAPFPVGKSLRDMVKAHTDQERLTLRSWSLLFEREGDLDGQPMIELGTRWRSEGGMVYQRQVHVGLDDVVLLLVGNGPLEERERTDAHVDRALATMRLRRGG
jgi:hypothetical protein